MATVTQFLFVTDLDNTLVGDAAALQVLNQKLAQHRQEHGTKIVYSTGRSLESYQELKAEQHLIEPDALVVAVGTEIYYQGSATPDATWSEKLSHHWDRDVVVATGAHFADLVPQPEPEQRPFKVSYFLTEEAAVEVLPQIEALLKERGLEVKLIYSSGKDFDILPRQADKGMAMAFLRQTWGIDPAQTVVCGDSGNDCALFSVEKERGIIVGNAQPEMLAWHEANPFEHHYLAKAHCAGGILEGLNYFGFL